MENFPEKEEEEEKKDDVDRGRVMQNFPEKEEEEEEEKREDVDRGRVTENFPKKEEEEEEKGEDVDRGKVMENFPEKEEEEKEEEKDDVDRGTVMENFPEKEEEEKEKKEDADMGKLVENFSEKQGEEEEQDGEEADDKKEKPPNLDTLTSQHLTPMISIKKIATMEKRCDFGLFIHKADVMVVGGQAENGNFLDDMLRIHVPTGQVCKADGKLAIPLSEMQVESTVIHQNYLVQFFDATSCFYGE